jgi:hypothetical protein
MKSHIRNSLVRPLTLAAALVLAVPAASQAQLSIEGRLGATLPTGDLSDIDQTAGLGLAAELMYSVQTNFTIYGGVGHHRFTCDDCDTDVTSTGIQAGGKYLFGSNTDAMPWVRGGLMLHRPDFDGDTGDWGAGLDAGVGIDWNVGPAFYLVPALRFNTYSSEDFNLRYLTIDLGAHFHLGS